MFYVTSHVFFFEVILSLLGGWSCVWTRFDLIDCLNCTVGQIRVKRFFSVIFFLFNIGLWVVSNIAGDIKLMTKIKCQMQSPFDDPKKTYSVHRRFPPILDYIPSHRRRLLRYSLYSWIHISRCNSSRKIHSYNLKKTKILEQKFYRLKGLDSFIDLYLIEI